MKKRHEIIALLAAAAGLGMAGTADATVTSRIELVGEAGSAGQEAVAARSNEELARMIHLAGSKGFERSEQDKGFARPKDRKSRDSKRDRSHKNPS